MKRADRNWGKKTITIQDVADAAGVSVSTVSRVLNEKDDVAPETYAKVKAVIQEMGYTSSLAARSMRSSRTNVVGMIMTDVGDPFSIEVLKGANRAVASLDYDLIVCTTGDVRRTSSAAQQRRYVALLNNSITDGVILVTPSTTDFPTAAPVVVVDPNRVSPDVTAVTATNRLGALSAMEYLLGLGHQRIGFISGRADLECAYQREQGYKDALREAGIPVEPELIQEGDFTTDTATLCARKLLELPVRPTAIFAANDQSAIGVMRAAGEAGLSIPDDLSLVGFDNIPETGYLTPALTTVDQFVGEIGYTATVMLVDLVQGNALESRRHMIPTKLVIRDSCRAIGPAAGARAARPAARQEQ
jgi:LacI family transcriptional regulator